MKLTKVKVDKAKYEGSSYIGKDGREKWSRHVLWDDEIKGFGLRITPDGVKTFVLSYRFNGRKRLMKLGRYGGNNTLDWARGRANKELRKVDEGIDPLRERSQARQDELQAKTLADLCDVFLERRAKIAKKTWRIDQGRIEKHIKPKLGHLRVEEVTRDRIGQFYRDIGSTRPYEANRLVALLSVMFNHAPLWGFLPEGTPNPAKMPKESMYKEKRRDRPMRSDELPKLLAAIQAEPDLYNRSAFMFLLLTGLRRNEVLRSKWEDVDLGRGTLRLPDTKAGKPRHVQLSHSAVEILKELRTNRMPGNPYVFPSPVKPGAPIYDLRKPWARIRKAAGCSDLRLHDLRHSVATWLAEEGFPAQTIQQAMGHQNIEQTMGYVHASDRGPREAMERLADKVLGG